MKARRFEGEAVYFRPTADMRKNLETLAEKTGRSMSDLMREAAFDLLRKHETGARQTA